MSEVVYLNGSLIAKDEAAISPEDRGFNFADGVYEVVKYYHGRPFRYNDHISRLKRSLLHEFHAQAQQKLLLFHSFFEFSSGNICLFEEFSLNKTCNRPRLAIPNHDSVNIYNRCNLTTCTYNH